MRWGRYGDWPVFSLESLDVERSKGNDPDTLFGKTFPEPLAVTEEKILEDNVPEKYYLSQKACEGFLRRAERRGKKLPDVLKTALEQQSAE